MIKILHLITDLDTGGAEMMLYKLLAGMDSSRFNNIVVSMTDVGIIGKQIKDLGVSVIDLNMRRGVPNPAGLLKLRQILREEHPDILQTWLYHADLLGLLTGKTAGVSKIIWNLRCSDIDLDQYSKLTALVVKTCTRLSRYTDVVIANSHAGLEFHRSLGYKPPMWSVIPNGFDLEKFRPNQEARDKIRRELGREESDMIIGLVARYDPMKDHVTFINAAKRMVDRSGFNNLYFLLVGHEIDDNNVELTETIAKAGLTQRFHLLGQRTDIPDIVAALDLFMLSSSSEGFPNVVGEAMACGVPCTVTNSGDSEMIVGNTGKVVPIKDPEALANAALEIIRMDLQERRKLGCDARYRIEQNYSIKSIIGQYEDLYREAAVNVRH